MEPITAIVGLATTLMNKIWGNKDDQLKQQFVLEFQKEISKIDLAKSQIQVNQAEASNPNRKWVTWRELCGYMVVGCLLWQWIILPIFSTLAAVTGNPIDPSKIIQVDLFNVLYILGIMLGADLSPVIANGVKNIKTKLTAK